MIEIQQDTERLRSLGVAVIAIGAGIAGLVYGRSFLLPLAVAIFLWSVLEAIVQGIAGLSIRGHRPPRSVALLLGLLSVGLGFYLITGILLGQVDAIFETWPHYVARLQTIISNFTIWLGPEWAAKVREAVGKLDMMKQVPEIIASTQSFVINALLVSAYLGFLLVERNYVAAKIAAIFPDEHKARETAGVFDRISLSVQRYIWIKTLVSILTGATCYVVLRLIGIHFAETWALLIFVLNFIPNIGSIIGVAFPAVLALVQFDTVGPFVVLAASLTAIQMAIGSVLEPMLMGNTLNMSPLAIILGLAFWGTIWGIVGMFLSVPILVVVMIVCANIPSWRWIAILLSKDGNIDREPQTA